jgi:hypothetical protein
VAARSKAWTVFARSNTAIVGSKSTQGMDVCVFVYSVFVLFCVYVEALRWADPPSEESYRLCIGLRNWKSGQGPKGYRAIEREKKGDKKSDYETDHLHKFLELHTNVGQVLVT